MGTEVIIKVGDWVVKPKVLDSADDKLVCIKSLSMVEGKVPIQEVSYKVSNLQSKIYPDVADYDLLDGGFQYEYYWTNPRTGVSHVREGQVLRPLTDTERKNLDIYLSGDFEKYPLITNDVFLREAVIRTLKSGIKPKPTNTLL